MTNRGSNTTTPGGLAVWLDQWLMALVAGKDRRLREAIASAATRACPHDDMESMTHWHARQDSASNRRVE